MTKRNTALVYVRTSVATTECLMRGPAHILTWEASVIGSPTPGSPNQHSTDTIADGTFWLESMAIRATIFEFLNMCIVWKVKMVIQIFDMYFYILEIYKHRAHSIYQNREGLMEESYYMVFFF